MLIQQPNKSLPLQIHTPHPTNTLQQTQKSTKNQINPLLSKNHYQLLRNLFSYNSKKINETPTRLTLQSQCLMEE